eukprot:13643_1
MKLKQPSNSQWFLINILALILIVNSSNSFNQNKQNTAETLGVTDNALLRRSINQVKNKPNENNSHARRLLSYMKQFYDDNNMIYEDEQILDEWINNLSLDETIYLYDLLQSQYNNDGYEEYGSYRYSQGERITEVDNPLIPFTWDESPTKGKLNRKKDYCVSEIDLCRANQILKYKESKIQIISNPIDLKDKKLFQNVGRHTPDIQSGEYLFKGLSYDKDTSGQCNSPPTDINSYRLQFSNKKTFYGNPVTTHRISPKDFAKVVNDGVKIKLGDKQMPKQLQTLTNKCLSFSGGGILASMAAYWTMRQIEKDNKLNEIKCISVISGGSWGFILWLFEDDNLRASEQIKTYISTNSEDKKWGPKVPHELVDENQHKNYWWKWIREIKTNILHMTSLKNNDDILFKGHIGSKLSTKKLNDVTVYFVVESVSLKKLKHQDYCWFKSDSRSDTFECAKNVVKKDKKKGVDYFPMNEFDFKVQKVDDPWHPENSENNKHFHDIRLVDVLSYCSSAWATEHVAMKLTARFEKTNLLWIHKKDDHAVNKKFRLIDSGYTMNDPLIPYMVYPIYTEENKYEIWNFEIDPIEHYMSGPFFDRYKHIHRLKEKMEAIDNNGNYELKKICFEEGMTIFESDNRMIKHCSLYGKEKHYKEIEEFPIVDWSLKANRWEMKTFQRMIDQWGAHLPNLLRSF